VTNFSKLGRSVTQAIIKNDFKKARREVIEIFNQLKNDPIMSENIVSFQKITLSSLAKIFLKSYTRVKISVVADNLILDLNTCNQFLESEIKHGRIDFKIDQDEQCLIKNLNNSLSYLHVLNRAKNLIQNKNESMSDKVLNSLVGTESHRNAKNLIFDLFSKIN
jgi:hypothetical protein